MIQWLRFVPFDELVVRLAEGWVVSDCLYGVAPHGAYAVLCVWEGDGEPS